MTRLALLLEHVRGDDLHRLRAVTTLAALRVTLATGIRDLGFHDSGPVNFQRMSQTFWALSNVLRALSLSRDVFPLLEVTFTALQNLSLTCPRATGEPRNLQAANTPPHIHLNRTKILLLKSALQEADAQYGHA
eukprot:SM000016S01942  [mRNA]  locus=s16:689624:690025:- [translate_table: standard]